MIFEDIRNKLKNIPTTDEEVKRYYIYYKEDVQQLLNYLDELLTVQVTFQKGEGIMADKNKKTIILAKGKLEEAIRFLNDAETDMDEPNEKYYYDDVYGAIACSAEAHNILIDLREKR